MKALVLSFLLATALPLTAQEFALTDVTVVDTRTGALSPHRTVSVRDGRIASVTDGPPQKGVAVVPGRNKYLIPGLWDMVTHLSWTRDSALPVLVANGVTAVRDEGGDLGELATWADGVRTGRLVGPTIFQVGPMLNGKSFNRYQYALESPEQAKAAIRLLKFEHVDGLEIERRVQKDVYYALMAEAKAAGLPVGGKVPIELTPMDVTNAGQTTIDNLETIYDGVFAEAHKANLVTGIDEFLSSEFGLKALSAALRANGTAVTPCLSALMIEAASANQASDERGMDRYVARSQRTVRRPMSASDLAEFQAMIPRLQKTVARLQSAGVIILAGTDIAASRVPGFTLQEELKALSDSGLTPLQVLQAATINPAKVMRLTADYGTIEQGKIADMVLLDQDPTKNVDALHRIDALVLHGQLLDRAQLNEQLRIAEQIANRD